MESPPEKALNEATPLSPAKIWHIISHSKSFKVIEVDTNGKPVRDFLLVINSN